MSYKVIGTIDTVFNEQEVGNNGFKKRVVWINTEEQYTQSVELQFVQANVDMLDGYKAGDKVEITFSINGRKTNSPQHGERIFNSLTAYQIKRL